MDNVFDTIRAEVARRHWSMAEFMEDKIGVDRCRYYYWEKAKDFPVSILIKMSEVLEIPTDVLLGLK